MEETGDASDCLARLARIDSDVCSRMNFHNNAFHHCTVSKMYFTVSSKKMRLERNERLQLIAANEELTKRNEEHAAEIQSLKRRLQASKASDTPGQQGSGCDHNQSGVQKGSVQKGKEQDQGHAGADAEEHEVTENLSGMNNLEQDLTTELRGVEDEIRITNAKPIMRTYGSRVKRVKDSAVKFQCNPRLAAMEEPESVGITTKPSRAKAAKFDFGKPSRTLAAKEELTKRNEEHASEIQFPKRRLQASKASDAPGLQGSGCDHKQSRVHKRSVQNGKEQDQGHAEEHEVTENLSAMNNLEQGLSTELGGVEDEIRITNAKPMMRTRTRTYKVRREVPAMRVEESARKLRRSPRLAAMEEPESVDIITTKPTRAKAAKFDVGKATCTLADSLRNDAGYVAVSSTSSATPAALHTIGQDMSPDELQLVMFLSSSMHR